MEARAWRGDAKKDNDDSWGHTCALALRNAGNAIHYFITFFSPRHNSVCLHKSKRS